MGIDLDTLFRTAWWQACGGPLYVAGCATLAFAWTLWAAIDAWRRERHG